jgi:hypothetical protein
MRTDWLVGPPFEPEFDLIKELASRPPEYDKDKVLWLEMYEVPTVLIIANLDRILAGVRCSKEVALCILIEHSFEENFNYREDKRQWQELRIALQSTEQEYDDPEDFAFIEEHCRDFKYKIRCSGTTKTRKIRMPIDLKSRVQAAAETLGIPLSTLCQILILDSLRSLPGVQMADEMSAIVEGFYDKLQKRTRLLAGAAKAFRLDLCEAAKSVISEVDL